MSNNNSFRQFLSTATEEDYQALAIHITNAPNKRDCLPDKERGWTFSYSSIAPVLEERGLLTRKHRTAKEPSNATCSTPSSAITPADTSTSKKPFIVQGEAPSGKKISRSVQLDEDVAARLKALENKCWQYTHAAVLNQLLKDALSIYGF